MSKGRLIALAGLFLAGCGTESTATGTPDTGALPRPDAGHGVDAVSPADATQRDADADAGGRSLEAAASDVAVASDAPGDTRSVDAPRRGDAPMDAPAGGPFTLAVPCVDTATQVYALVPNLPPMTDTFRGDIVACTNDGAMTEAQTLAQLNAQPDTNPTATSGVSVYRVQFRTTRSNGSDGYSTARVYLPLVPVSASPPVIVAAHGTEGLAASCATTMSATSMRDLALPWAALGYPVIAPDYAGLGTPGVQGYEDNRDTARSVVDSVAALRKLVTQTLGNQVVIDGHSQGGGAALATQALAKEMNLQGTLAAVLAFAPEYYSHLDALGYLGALESVAVSNPLTITTGITKCTVATMLEYAYFANHVSIGNATAGFPAAEAQNLGTAIESFCTIPLGGAVQADAPLVADWTDPSLRADLLACVTAGGRDAGIPDGGVCTGAGQAFYKYLQQNILAPDPSGAPVLIVQGLADVIIPPDQETACNVDALKAGGLTPTVCTDAPAIHTNVVQRNIAFGIQWAQAVLAGTPPPPCAASALPACSQP